METLTVTINQKKVALAGERNLLEVIRKAGIDLPTFCYHSELSIYGACRLCIVDVEGRGIVPSCSTPPEAGMTIRTHTREIREIRKMIVELLLANHDNHCTTCQKNTSCQLQALAQQLGINHIRFKSTLKEKPVDLANPSLIRNPNKCVLCGDCVRVCAEIQGIGAIGFSHRGSEVTVAPAFGKNLNQVDCVFCGQCAKVCPTGAITPKSEISPVWQAIYDLSRTVVVQVAPAVRVAIGEAFGLEPGVNVTGQIVTALRQLGFDKVYDTSFTADLTIVEEATEFKQRLENGGPLPLLTSCCPAWVQYMEQYAPRQLAHLSSCKSPQQMFGSLAKDHLPAMLGIERETLTVVSVMPCTAKKTEARRAEHQAPQNPDVDYVLTTQELASMIKEAGVDFKALEPDSFDSPFGVKTGAGVIFGNSGGVTEAVLRYASEVLSGQAIDSYEFKEVRGNQGLLEAEVEIGGTRIKLAVVHGLKNAGALLQALREGKADYHFVEVMACPNGCIGGAGQPVQIKSSEVNLRRTRGLYETDKTMQLHKPQENPGVAALYRDHLGTPGSEKAHHLLHTAYKSRRRIESGELPLIIATHSEKLSVRVCVGTSCYLKGSQNLLNRLVHFIEEQQLQQRVDVKASFCFEACDKGPNVVIDGQTVSGATFEAVREGILRRLEILDQHKVAT